LSAFLSELTLSTDIDGVDILPVLEMLDKEVEVVKERKIFFDDEENSLEDLADLVCLKDIKLHDNSFITDTNFSLPSNVASCGQDNELQYLYQVKNVHLRLFSCSYIVSRSIVLH
jgi:hypothetical protein